jgi:hypothetical protein
LKTIPIPLILHRNRHRYMCEVSFRKRIKVFFLGHLFLLLFHVVRLNHSITWSCLPYILHHPGLLCSNLIPCRHELRELFLRHLICIPNISLLQSFKSFLCHLISKPCIENLIFKLLHSSCLGFFFSCDRLKPHFIF